MKYLLKISILLTVISCGTSKKVIIPYVLNISAEKSIKEFIQKLSYEKKKDIAFYISYQSDGKYKISCTTLKDKKTFEYTDRHLYIDQKFYPIIFSSDYAFYGEVDNGNLIINSYDMTNTEKKIKAPSLSERIENESHYGYPIKYLIIDAEIYWIVDNRGRLVETNSDGN